MNISNSLRTELINEIKFVISKIKKEPDLRKKSFFFSGVYSLVNRIFNLSFDPQLVFIHLVLNATHTTINSRINSIVMGKDTLIDLPDDLFDKLCDSLEELAEKIEKDEDTYSILQKLSVFAYVTTGNGYFLLNNYVLFFRPNECFSKHNGAIKIKTLMIRVFFY